MAPAHVVTGQAPPSLQVRMGSDWWCRTNWWCRHGICLFQGFWTFHGTDITRNDQYKNLQCQPDLSVYNVTRCMVYFEKDVHVNTHHAIEIAASFSGYGTQEASLATLTLQYMLAILQLCQGSFQRLPSLFQAWVALCGWTLDFWNASHALQTLVGCHFSCRKVTSESQTIVVMYIIRWVKTFKQVVRNRMLLGLLSRSCWLDYSKRMIRYCIEPIFRQGLDFCVPWVGYSRDPKVARLALGMEVGEGAIWRQSCASAAVSLKIHNMSFLEL